MSHDRDRLLERLLEPWLRSRHTLADLDDTFAEMARLLASRSSGAVGAAVVGTVAGEDLAFRGVSGSAIDAMADLAQRTGEGPGVAAVRDGTCVHVRVDDERDRWPQWVPTASDSGVGAVCAVPFGLPARTLGAVIVYHRAAEVPLPWRHEADRVAMLAGVAAERMEFGHQMRQAMDSRLAIGEAIGVLRSRYRLDHDGAVAYLKRRSSQSNVKVARVAEQLVDQEDGVLGR
ncbi:ANTAR domain-containing protein [Nocardioides sp.]|uniref:ANTAR domain-containing protein n=1 Tax=Nocardioides sp. TaxID=35761 RepID=UPI003514C17B